MKIFISYYYQIRFLKTYQIPISTTGGDPKWYHDYKDQDYVYLDKNGVFNGIREPLLSFPKTEYEKLNEQCSRNCPYSSKNGNCEFMLKYKEHLDSIDFNYILSEFNRVANDCRKIKYFEEEPEIILIVYEHPKIPCAERPVLVQWFKEHGVDVKEWEKKEDEDIIIF